MFFILLATQLTNIKRISLKGFSLFGWNRHPVLFENNDSRRLRELVVGFEVKQKVPPEFAPLLAADC